MKMRLTLAMAALLSITATLAQAQQIVQSRGVDSRVDYKSLTQFGPWDDRNYDLNADDLEFLAPNEAELSLAIPAFFRVKLRQHSPRMLREGPVQYTLSAPEVFLQMYGGFLIDGKIYTRVTRDDAGLLYVIVDDSGVEEKEFFVQREREIEALVSGEVRVTGPGNFAESAVAIHPTDPNKVIAGANGPGGQVMFFSTDGGATWALSAGLPLGGTCCDPTIEWSTDGTTAITTTLGCGLNPCDVWAYRTGDDGATWTDFATGGSTDPRREVATGGGHDKQFLHRDRHPGSPNFGNLYMTWHRSNILRNAVSTDNGETWSTVTFSGAGPERGVGSDVTSDKGGNVYVAWPAFNSADILIRKSTDGGATFPATVKVADTFAQFQFPLLSQETRGVAVIVSTDADTSNGPFGDSIYVGWTDSTADTFNVPTIDNHGRVRVAYSRDGGATWTTVTVHPTGDAATVDRWQGWMEVDEGGRVHVIFNSTINDPTRTGIDVYHVVSTDGGITYSTPERLTGVTSPNINTGFEFGDYSSMSVAMNNVMASFTDNRNEGGGGGNSVDVYVSGFPADGVAADIFDDGFESGDTGAWDVTVP